MLTYLHPEAVKKFLKTNNIENVQITLEYLKRFGKAFQKIPYENATKLIRSRSVSEPESRIRLPELLFEEHLKYGTGGTCFSMTYFMQVCLKAVGFSTYAAMADRPLANNMHCASVVELDGKKYLLDPGFIINTPLELTDMPVIYHLGHNDIMINRSGERYEISTVGSGKKEVRYFLKDAPVEGEDFLKYWQDSFNWPTLRNISITTATDKGYIYARNDFIRTTTSEGRTQERLKSQAEQILGKTFNIDIRIIGSAFEILREIKR